MKKTRSLAASTPVDNDARYVKYTRLIKESTIDKKLDVISTNNTLLPIIVDISYLLARTGFFKPVHVKSLSAHALRSLIIARKKLVGQRVTLENQIRGLAVVFGIRLPRALTRAFVNQALKASKGIAGLSAAMRGLIAARTAVMTAVAAIDADMRRMARASPACSRLMTIPGVGQLTALAFVAAIDDPSRIRRSRDVGAYLGLVPRRYQSGEVDYVGSISKCGDRRVRTLLYEAANVMLTRYKGQLKLKDWAFAIAKRSTMRKARVALARRLGIIMHAMLSEWRRVREGLARKALGLERSERP